MTDSSSQGLVLLDLEWTPDPTGPGFAPIELALLGLHVDQGQWVQAFFYETLLNPGVPLDENIERLTGITNKALSEAPYLTDVFDQLDLYTRDFPLYCHGASKDRDVLESALRQRGLELNRQWKCSLELAREQWPGLLSYELRHLNQMLEGPEFRPHRAGEDVRALSTIIKALLPATPTFSPPKPRPLKLFFPKLQTPGLKSFEDLPSAPGTLSFYEHKRLVHLLEGRDLQASLRGLCQHPEIDRLKTITRLEWSAHPHELGNIVLTEVLKQRFRPALTPYFETKLPWALFHYTDQEGIIQFKIRKAEAKKRRPLAMYESKVAAMKELAQLTKKAPKLIYSDQSPEQRQLELKRQNKERLKALDSLSYGEDWQRLALINSERDDWLMIENGRCSRMRRAGKEIQVKETPWMRYLLIQRLKEIRTRKTTLYQFEMLKRSYRRELPVAGTRLASNTRTGTLDSSLAMTLRS